MPTNQPNPTDPPDPSRSSQPDWETISTPYMSLRFAMCRIVIGAGALIASYGPYTPIEAGRIMKQCAAEGIPALLRFECGPEFDWEFARDMSNLLEIWGRAGEPLSSPDPSEPPPP